MLLLQEESTLSETWTRWRRYSHDKTMEKMQAFLRNNEVCGRLREAEIVKVCEQACIAHFSSGTCIINQGDKEDNAFFWLVSGRVEVIKSDEDGLDIVVGHLNSGDYYGEVI